MKGIFRCVYIWTLNGKVLYVWTHSIIPSGDHSLYRAKSTWLIGISHTHTLTHSQTHTLNQREKSIHSGREISEQYVALIHCIAFPHPSRISFKIKKEPASVSALKQGGIPSSRVMKATQKHLAQHSQNMFVNLARWQWRPWVLPNAHNTYNEEVFLPWGGLISINWNL
jgi:hypothetical protein